MLNCCGQWVVTAAHCTVNRRTKVSLGEHNFAVREVAEEGSSNKVLVLGVEQVIKHPDYLRGDR